MRISGDILRYQDIREFNGILGDIRGYKRFRGYQKISGEIGI